MAGRRKFLKQTVAGLALGGGLGKALVAADQAMGPPPKQTIDHFTPTPLWLAGQARQPVGVHRRTHRWTRWTSRRRSQQV